MHSLLHCHFESALRALALTQPQKLRPLWKTYESEKYQTLTPGQRLTLLWRTVMGLSHGEDIFTENTFREIVRRLLLEMTESDVEHVDLRIGPSTGRWKWMESATDGLDVFREELHDYTSLSIAFLAGINMNRAQTEVDAIFDTLTLDGSLTAQIVGVDLNFLPNDLHKFDRYVSTLRKLQADGLKINIHLGELFDNELSRYVLSQIIPDRIGHGVLLLRDQTLVDAIRDHDICLDMCPTSNTLLGVTDWTRVSPASHALKLGIPVSINTDDPVLFGTTIARELCLAGLSDPEQEQVAAYSRKYRYDGP